MASENPTDREELSTACMLFSELYDIGVSLKTDAKHPTKARKDALVIDLSSLALGSDAERFVNLECARYFWLAGCRDDKHDYRGALEKVGQSVVLAALVDDAKLLDEFGLRVLLFERMQDEGCLEAFAKEADIVEMDRFANSVAMRFCELDNWIEQNDDPRVDEYLQIWTDAVSDAFNRYVGVRRNVHFARLPGADPSLGANVGLEALAEHEEFLFLIDVCKPAEPPTQARRSDMQQSVEPLEIKVALDTDELLWPRDLASASGNQEYEDLSGTTWAEVDEALAGESALLTELVEASPGRELVDLGDDVDEISYVELGVPTDFGTCAATLALNAAGCPTISACAGHMGGYPHIAFWARPSAKGMLVAAATAARIGLGNAHYGAAEVFTNPDDALGMIRFAAELRAAARAPAPEASTSVARVPPTAKTTAKAKHKTPTKTRTKKTARGKAARSRHR